MEDQETNAPIYMLEKNQSLVQALFKDLSRNKFFLPKFNSQAINKRNLMKATQSYYFTVSITDVCTVKGVERPPLTRNLRTCYFYLFHLVQGLFNKPLPWGCSLPNKEYVETLLFLYDKNDFLNLRTVENIPDSVVPYFKKSKKKLKQRTFQRAFSKTKKIILRKVRFYLKKMETIHNRVKDNLVFKDHIIRLKKNVESELLSFCKSVPDRVLIDPIFSEFQILSNAIGFDASIPGESAVDFLAANGIEIDNEQVKLAKITHNVPGSDFYLNKNDYSDEGALLYGFNKGFSRLGKAEFNRREKTVENVMRLYRTGIVTQREVDDFLNN